MLTPNWPREGQLRSPEARLPRFEGIQPLIR